MWEMIQSSVGHIYGTTMCKFEGSNPLHSILKILPAFSARSVIISVRYKWTKSNSACVSRILNSNAGVGLSLSHFLCVCVKIDRVTSGNRRCFCLTNVCCACVMLSHSQQNANTFCGCTHKFASYLLCWVPFPPLESNERQNNNNDYLFRKFTNCIHHLQWENA